MADNKDEKNASEAGEEGAPPKKSKLLLIVFIFLGSIILVGGSVGATLYFSGFFNQKPPAVAKKGDAEHGEAENGDAAHGDAAHGEADSGDAGHGDKESKQIPAVADKFVATYKGIERDFTINIPGSRKFVQFKVAYKTFFGDKVVERVVKHDIAIQAAILSTATQFNEDEMTSIEGRVRFASALRDAMNDVLIRNEDFGGIEEVLFVSFVFQ